LSRTQFALDPDGQTFTGVLVHDGQHPERLAVAGAVGDEVVRPDMILAFRTQPDARTIIEPQPSTLRLTSGNLESFLTPYPLDSLNVDSPSLLAQ
jgi:hypothetical protein